jgi:hypothetical protein
MQICAYLHIVFRQKDTLKDAVPEITKNGEWAFMESNHGPQSYQDCALTI